MEELCALNQNFTLGVPEYPTWFTYISDSSYNSGARITKSYFLEISSALPRFMKSHILNIYPPRWLPCRLHVRAIQRKYSWSSWIWWHDQVSELIFAAASLCLCVCVCVCVRLARWPENTTTILPLIRNSALSSLINLFFCHNTGKLLTFFSSCLFAPPTCRYWPNVKSAETSADYTSFWDHEWTKHG